MFYVNNSPKAWTHDVKYHKQLFHYESYNIQLFYALKAIVNSLAAGAVDDSMLYKMRLARSRVIGHWVFHTPREGRFDFCQ